MVFTVAIAGISSRLARLIAQELLKSPHVRIRGSSRNTSALPDWMTNSDRVALVQTGPFDKEKLRELVRGSDVVICCYVADNETQLKGQRLLIRLCEEQGVRRYVASDYTVDYTKLERGEIWLKEPMQVLYEELQGNGKVKGVHVLNGLFMESFVEAFTGLETEEAALPYWGTGQERFETTSYGTTAEYVAAVALDETATGIFRFLGDQISVLEIAAQYEATYGVQPNLNRLGSLDDLKNIAYKNDTGAYPLNTALHVIMTGKASLGNRLDNRRYPQIEPQSFKQWLESRKKSVK